MGPQVGSEAQVGSEVGSGYVADTIAKYGADPTILPQSRFLEISWRENILLIVSNTDLGRISRIRVDNTLKRLSKKVILPWGEVGSEVGSAAKAPL